MKETSTVLPRDKGAAPLDFVIAVMAFLAALALGASLIADRATEGWQSGPGRRSSRCRSCRRKQATPRQRLDTRDRRGVDLLRATPGIAHAAPLSDAELDALVEPWVGKGRSDRRHSPAPADRRRRSCRARRWMSRASPPELKQVAPHAMLDDHRRWIARLSRHRRHGALFRLWHPAPDRGRHRGGGILRHPRGPGGASRDGGAAASDGRARRLHRRARWSGIISFPRWCAALLGTLLAALLFLGAGGLEHFGVEAVPFLPPLSLDWTEMPWLLAVPAATALIAWATARISVLSVVRAIY